MKHSGIRIWLAQAGILSCIGMMLLRIYGVFYLSTPRHISMLLCGLAVFIFMTALPVFYRSFRYKMQEIEAAAKLSVSRLFLAEMITIAIGDAVMLGTVIGITVFKASYSISSALLYLVVPFLVMWCVVFRLLKHVNMEKMVVYGSVICLAVLFLIGLTGKVYPVCFEKTFSAGWAGVWGLLGANGAGKTTLMRMIAGIMKPDGGQILYDGIPIQVMGENYRDIFGYLPQEFGFYPEFTVKDYLEYVAALKGLTRPDPRKEISELLERLSLQDVRNKKIAKLSGGMKRRVGIAQALLNDPHVLILDEPTSGLDPGERVRFRNLLSEFAHDRIVLISTHIVSDVEYIATKNAVMKTICIVKRQKKNIKDKI